MPKKLVHTAVLFIGIINQMYAQTLEPLSIQGSTFIHASSGKPLTLRGFNIANNVWGYWQWPVSDALQAQDKDPLIKPLEMAPYMFTQADADHIQPYGSNVARYQINYELFSESNSKRDANITLLRTHIQQLADIGVYTVICLSMQPGLNVQNDNYERNKAPSVRIKSVFESDSTFVLWRSMWQFVAANLQDLPAVAGYELLNEPRRPTLAEASDADIVNAYTEVIDSIRSKDPDHIIFICDFNSQEANPGEPYWDNTANHFVTDAGEQGIRWEKKWIAMPDAIENIAYVTHIYEPSDFTLSGAPDFTPSVAEQAVTNAVHWAYTQQNRPLFISEYGVSYEHTFNGHPEKRMAWVTQIHALFEQHNISSAYFQYKTMLTPFVNLKTELGLWFQYYDLSTIKTISNGVITYDQTNTRDAAIANGIDAALKTYFIENDQIRAFSTLNNSDVLLELKRYFGVAYLGIRDKKATAQNDVLYLSDPTTLTIQTNLLPSSGILELVIYSVDGNRLQSGYEQLNAGVLQVNIPSLPPFAFYIIQYGNQEQKRTGKIVIP